MYTAINYRTKKALKEAVKSGKQTIGVYQPGPFPSKKEGTVCIEGPHYPEPHKWYAQAVIKDGFIISVK